MPAIIQGNRFNRTTFRPKVRFDYEYNTPVPLIPGTPVHNKLRDFLIELAYSSADVMSNRYNDWSEIDHTLTAYIPVDEDERIVKERDSRKPVSIVFPYTYTILETLLSFFTSAFLTDPIFRYDGTSPDDVIGTILLEKLISTHCIKNKVGLNLHTQARDAFSYGFGVTTPVWKTEYGPQTVKTISKGFFGLGKTETTTVQNQLLFEGNALENIDPYLYLPDTSVPIHAPQEGEFVGWISKTNYLTLLNLERNSNNLFNVRYLEALLGRGSSIIPTDNSGRDTKTGISSESARYYSTNKSVDLLKIFCKIIPKDYSLGDSEYPEMWYFEIGTDEVIIQARPTGLNHGKFPVSVMAPDYDGYSISPVSKIEMLYGMQGILDFMFNSHIANVRKAINDMLIYDPYLVNTNDLKNPSPGKLVRLRRPAWGRGVQNVVQQLAVSDVTRANVSDSTWIVQWMDRISGADASMQGALRQGGPERLTGAEFQGTRAGGISRLERVAKIIGMQGMQDIGTFFASHAIQLMENPNWIKIAGEWQEVLLLEYGNEINRGRLKVDPSQLDVNYDIIVKDGSIPGGNYSQIWVQLYKILGENPELAQQFDMVRIFKHIARDLGAKNINDFVKRGGNVNPVTMPSEQVKNEAQKGNIIPVNSSNMVQ